VQISERTSLFRHGRGHALDVIDKWLSSSADLSGVHSVSDLASDVDFHQAPFTF
jgi:hypothetical protein